MKKWLVGAMAALCALTVSASECVDAGFWFDCPESLKTQDVSGVRFGLPISSSLGAVSGLELALLLADTAEVNGMQFTILGANSARFLDGLQLAALNIVRRDLCGLQLGLFNQCVSGGCQIGLINMTDGNVPCQIGLINFNPRGWLPVTILFNCGPCDGSASEEAAAPAPEEAGEPASAE